jgi:hypothetical protein
MNASCKNIIQNLSKRQEPITEYNNLEKRNVRLKKKFEIKGRKTPLILNQSTPAGNEQQYYIVETNG